jgi:hypothetical protein
MPACAAVELRCVQSYKEDRVSSADDLDQDLRELYAAERALPPVLDSAARSRVLAAVGHATAATTGYSLATVIVASIASAVVGAGIAVGVMVARGDRAAPTPPDASVVAPVDAAVVVPVDAPSVAPADAAPRAPVAPLAPETRRRAVDAGVAAPAGDLTAGERNLIDRARAALARDRAHEAMVALMQHERAYADGTMREDREYLVIVALLAQGKRDLAATRAAAYRARYPRGTYLDAIARALE